MTFYLMAGVIELMKGKWIERGLFFEDFDSIGASKRQPAAALGVR